MWIFTKWRSWKISWKCETNAHFNVIWRIFLHITEKLSWNQVWRKISWKCCKTFEWIWIDESFLYFVKEARLVFVHCLPKNSWNHLLFFIFRKFSIIDFTKVFMNCKSVKFREIKWGKNDCKTNEMTIFFLERDFTSFSNILIWRKKL